MTEIKMKTNQAYTCKEKDGIPSTNWKIEKKWQKCKWN